MFLRDELLDGDGRTHGIAGPNGRPEPQVLGHVDGAGTGQLVGERCRDHAGRQHAVGDTALEDGGRRELLVGMDGVVVARHGREQDDIGFRDGLGVGRGHPHAKLFEFITTELIHRTTLPSILCKPERHLVEPCDAFGPNDNEADRPIKGREVAGREGHI